MSWSEDDWGKPIFPTRFGQPTGHSNERKMLDIVGGFDGIRRRAKLNADGSTTILKTRGGMPVFYTESDQAVPGYETTCRQLVSGMTLLGWYVIDSQGNRKMWEYFPAAHEPRSKAWSGVNYTLPGDADVPANLKMEALNPQPGSPVPDGFVSNYRASQLTHIKPGLYSGDMRKLVQYMLGFSLPVPFSYLFTKTHGVFNVPIGNGKTKPWLVEISSTNGVLVTPLKYTICPTVDRWNRMQFIPVASDLPCQDSEVDALVASGRVKRLLTASQLSTFYGKSPFFNECGWGFSYSSSNVFEAQNTCWSWPTRYKEAYRYKISFAVSGGDITGATLSVEDSGYMVGNFGETTNAQVRVPNYSNLTCVTFDMKPEGVFYQDVDSECPVYVYYDPVEGEQIVRWINNVPLERDLSSEYPPYSTWNPIDPGTYGVEYLSSILASGYEGYTYQIESPIVAARYGFYGSSYQTKKPVLEGGFPQFAYSAYTGFDLASFYQYCNFRQHDVSKQGEVKQRRHNLTIPLFDREGIYHWYKDSDGESVRVEDIKARHVQITSAGSWSYSIGREYDNNLNQYVGPYLFNFVGYQANPAWNPQYSLADTPIDQGASLSFLGSSTTSESLFGIYSAQAKTTPSISTTNDNYLHGRDLLAKLSGLSIKTYGSSEPDDTEWVSVTNETIIGRIQVARSAGGLYFLPTKNNPTPSDIDASVGAYPTPPFNAPWVALLNTVNFIGNAESEPITAISKTWY